MTAMLINDGKSTLAIGRFRNELRITVNGQTATVSGDTAKDFSRALKHFVDGDYLAVDQTLREIDAKDTADR